MAGDGCVLEIQLQGRVTGCKYANLYLALYLDERPLSL